MNLSKIRDDIERQREDALERRQKLARHVDHRAEPLPPDFAEQAQEAGNDEAMVALSVELDSLIDELSRALQRIEDGSYGRCATCGSAINASRLQALPAATVCVTCAD